MIPSQPARSRTRPPRQTTLTVIAFVAAVAIGVTTIGVMALWPVDATPSDLRATPRSADGQPTARPAAGISTVPTGQVGRQRRSSPTLLADEGVVSGGTTVFDDGTAAVSRLDPALLQALRNAAQDADDDGVTFRVNSGWRAAAYQERLLKQAVAEYGSIKAAARWVATPETSPHVSGDAVDLGPWEATHWLSEHGAAYGLCQIYRNEPWHYELRSGAVDHGCPATYADPTQDPRMQR